MMNNYYHVKRGLMSCLMVLGVATAFAQSTLPDPLFYYKFEDGSGNFATDETGTNDGEFFGTTDTTWVGGYENGGFQFDGATYLEVPSQGLSSNSGSFAAWVKGFDGRIRTIFSAGDNTDGGGFGGENEMHLHLEQAATDVWAGSEASFYQHNGGAREFFIWSDPEKGLADPAVPPVNPTTFGDTVWRHIAVVWGGGNVKMYVNGSLLADTTWNPTAAAYNFSVIRVGTMLNGGRGFLGVLDEVQAWDWILTDAEVMEVYDQAVGIGREQLSFPVTAFPNPAQNQLNVEFAPNKVGKVAEVALVNTQGQTLMTERHTTSGGVVSARFDVSALPTGIYIVKVLVDGQSSYQRVSID